MRWIQVQAKDLSSKLLIAGQKQLGEVLILLQASVCLVEFQVSLQYAL